MANYNGGAVWNGQAGSVTTVRSGGTRSASYFGTYDQNGNVWEWTESLSGSNRGKRGGSFLSAASALVVSGATPTAPAFEENKTGFRIARALACTGCDLDSDGVPNEILDPANTWGSRAEYFKKYDALAARFIENFKLLAAGCPPEVVEPGPRRLTALPEKVGK